MKRLTLALLATAAAALAATSARADTRVSIGVNVGGPVYRPAPPAVVYAPAPAPQVVYAPAPIVDCPPPAVVVAPPSRGYWKEIQVKTWVPERWVVRTNRWGRTERVCEPGYYTYRTDRVWVDARPDHGRGYAYGYGHDNRGGYDNRGWNR